MPKIRSAISSPSTWSASEILRKYGSSYSKLSYTNPAFDLGRINNHGQLEFQKDKPQEHIVTRFQPGDYVTGKRYSDGRKIRGRILTIQNREGHLDRVYISYKGNRTRIDASSMLKLEESDITSFHQFELLLESKKP